MKKTKRIKRGDFLKLAAGAALSGAFLSAARAADEDASQVQEPAVDLSKIPQELIQKNELLRMQEDLLRALKKAAPAEEMGYGPGPAPVRGLFGLHHQL